jgi:transcriptional regulator with XRE-family HTH domain
MKQPELGKRITDLRKAKGLTQEELVEQCKLSVRTLQRIESGEVTPRSYTLRAIFAVLDYDFNASLDNSESKSNTTGLAFKKWLEQFYLYVLDLFNLKTNTMKKISILSITTLSLALILVTVFSESEAQTTAQIKKNIIQSNKNFIEWFNAGQVDSIASLYDKDACLEGRGCGKDFIVDYYKLETTKYKCQELATSNITVNNDIALETGIWKFKLPTGVSLSGNYRSEWRLVNNKWVIYKDAVIPTEQ